MVQSDLYLRKTRTYLTDRLAPASLASVPAWGC